MWQYWRCMFVYILFSSGVHGNEEEKGEEHKLVCSQTLLVDMFILYFKHLALLQSLT